MSRVNKKEIFNTFLVFLLLTLNILMFIGVVRNISVTQTYLFQLIEIKNNCFVDDKHHNKNAIAQKTNSVWYSLLTDELWKTDEFNIAPGYLKFSG